VTSNALGRAIPVHFSGHGLARDLARCRGRVCAESEQPSWKKNPRRKGRRLRRAVIGNPTGKSSFVNALLNEDALLWMTARHDARRHRHRLPLEGQALRPDRYGRDAEEGRDQEGSRALQRGAVGCAPSGG